MPGTAPIFLKSTIAQLHYVEISCAKFHSDRWRNLEITGRNPVTPL